MRVIVYTGKGGVGKTSVAAATAAHLAAQGKRTLIMSTDAAHSLSDSLDIPLGPDPVPVAENLWAQEIDSLREAERSWGSVQKWLTGIMDWAKISDINPEELLVFPGMEELFSLLQIRKQAESGQYDTIIVDCAPTGETLRLLSFPSTLYWWIEKMFPYKRRMLKVARPVAKVVGHGLELPSEQVMDDVERLFHELQAMQELLLDSARTSIRIVVNPEKMVIAEARRSFTYLNLYGFNTDAVIINRVLPEEAEHGYMSGWREIQAKYMCEIEEAFSPLPILRVPLMTTEVVGLAMLQKVAAAAFQDVDADAILYRGRVEEVRKEGSGYILDLAIPFAPKEQLNLTQRGDELTVQVGAYKRKVILARSLMGRPILGARHADQRLLIKFGDRPSEVSIEGGVL
ncbi:MAG: ArsA family ATPase [Bacillota bacterium]